MSTPTVTGEEAGQSTSFLDQAVDLALGLDLALRDWAAIAALIVAAVVVMQFRRTIRQHRATILLNMHDRWNSEPFVNARENFSKLMKKVDDEVREENKSIAPTKFLEKTKELFSERLDELHTENIDEYNELKRLCNFFEMAGYLAREGYIPQKDLIEVFGGAILSVGRVFEHHVEFLQTKSGTTGKVWEHMMWLVSRTRAVAAQTDGSMYRNL